MNKEKVVFPSIILIASGLLTLGPSINTQAQIYDLDLGNDHYKVYPDPKKNSDVNVQKLKCVNSNINVNGIDMTEIPQNPTALAATNVGGAEGTAEAENTQNDNANGNGITFDRTLVNICVNVNLNDQIKPSPLEE
jgi:hypothetical protein